MKSIYIHTAKNYDFYCTHTLVEHFYQSKRHTGVDDKYSHMALKVKYKGLILSRSWQTRLHVLVVDMMVNRTLSKNTNIRKI